MQGIGYAYIRIEPLETGIRLL